MAKKRWTDAEERIIAWAQLSGITAKDFVRIGARIRRDENIAERAQEIERSLQGCLLEKFKDGWLFRPAIEHTFKHTGKSLRRRFDFYIRKVSSYPSVYEIRVLDDAGQAFSQTRYTPPRWHESAYPNRIYPENSKEVFLVIQAVNRGGMTWKNLKKAVKVLDGNVA